MLRFILWMTVALVALLVFIGAAVAQDASADFDQRRLNAHATRFEASVSDVTRCPDVRYVLHADDILRQTFDYPVNGMATRHLPAHLADGRVLPRCTVWLKTAYAKRTLAHEILHTAGFGFDAGHDAPFWNRLNLLCPLTRAARKRANRTSFASEG